MAKRLTDIGSATGVTLSDFIHIVITGDTVQNSAGSSYKASLQQVYDTFNNYGYKKYVALMNQTLSAAPTATILENTLGNIVWTKSSTGVFYGTLIGAFPLNKTFVMGGSPDINSGGGDIALMDIRRVDDDNIIMNVFDNFSPFDNLLVNTSIEIKVYD